MIFNYLPVRMPALVLTQYQLIIHICEVRIMDWMKFLASFLGFIRFGISKINRHIFLAIAAALTFISLTSPVFAHHALGGRTPSNFWEGFLSGIAHPTIGFDHFAFVVAIGILAAVKPQGILIPLGFLLAAMGGTGLHLIGVSLPVVELMVSASILLFGALIVIKDNPKTLVVMALATLAGLVHGYAYGEAIFGASIVPVFSYLVGFTVMQMIIAYCSYAIAQKFLDAANLRSAGFLICGVGLAFMSSQIVNLIFPLAK
jgi:urease accessory protein